MDRDFAHDLAVEVLHRVRKHIGVHGAEIDYDNETEHMEELVREMRRELSDDPVAASASKLNEWDYDYPRNNKFEDWPLDKVAKYCEKCHHVHAPGNVCSKCADPKNTVSGNQGCELKEPQPE